MTDQNSAEVVKTTIDGRTLMNLQRPDIAPYQGSGKFAPTWVAVNEERVRGVRRGSSRGRKNALACAYAVPLGLKDHLELQIIYR